MSIIVWLRRNSLYCCFTFPCVEPGELQIHIWGNEGGALPLPVLNNTHYYLFPPKLFSMSAQYCTVVYDFMTYCLDPFYTKKLIHKNNNEEHIVIIRFIHIPLDDYFLLLTKFYWFSPGVKLQETNNQAVVAGRMKKK